MLNIAICDDELHMLNKLSLLLEKVFIKNDFEAKIILKTTDYKELLSSIKSNTINVVFLDIEFKNSDKNGLNIANEIRRFDKNCYIIFLTSHLEYIIQAYDYKTFAYLFKNSLNVDSISNVLTRLIDDISGNSIKFLRLSNKGIYVDLDDIQFIEKNGMKLICHTSSSQISSYISFSKILDKLPNNFVQCHKSFIANVNNIVNISFITSTITFKNNELCYIGPKYKNLLMEVINYDTIFE